MKRTKDSTRLFAAISVLVAVIFLATAFFYKTNSTPAVQSRFNRIAPSDTLSITHPPDFSFDYKTNGITINWTITEAGAPSRYFIVYGDGTGWLAGNWTSGIPVITYVSIYAGVPTVLDIGPHNYTIVVTDGLGGKVSDEVDFNVLYFNPRITHPADITYYHGNPYNDNWIHWNITGDDLVYPYGTHYYTIYQNGAILDSEYWWSGQGVNLGVDGLLIGMYNYTIKVMDSCGNTTEDMVLVNVLNPLSIMSPGNITYYPGSTGHWIRWNITDAIIGNARSIVYQNGSVIDNSTWTTSYQFDKNVDGFPVGWSCNFTVKVTEDYWNWINDTIFVKVAHPLNVTHPGNLSNPRGNGGFYFDWYIRGADAFNPRYTIYQNGGNYASGSWFDKDFIYVIPPMSLPLGVHNFTIVVTDGIGGTVKDTSWVTITNPLTVTSPADIASMHPITGVFQWQLNNVNSAPSTFNVSKNGTFYSGGTWSYSRLVSCNYTGLAPGSYNFTIVAKDYYNDTISDTVIVTVWNPLNVTHPADISIIYGNSTTIQWHLMNVRSNNTWFKVYRNGTLIDNGTWFCSCFVNENISGLAVGSYNYTIVAWDINNAKVSDTVIVMVTSKPSPSPGVPFDTTTFIVVTMLFVPIFAITIFRKKMTKTTSK